MHIRARFEGYAQTVRPCRDLVCESSGSLAGPIGCRLSAKNKGLTLAQIPAQLEPSFVSDSTHRPSVFHAK